MTRKPKKPEELAKDLTTALQEVMKGFIPDTLYVPKDVAAYFTVTHLIIDGVTYVVVPKEVLEEYLEARGLGRWLRS